MVLDGLRIMSRLSMKLRIVTLIVTATMFVIIGMSMRMSILAMPRFFLRGMLTERITPIGPIHLGIPLEVLALRKLRIITH